MRNSRAIFWLSTAILLVSAAHLFLSYGGRKGEAEIKRSALAESAETATAIAIEREGGDSFSLVRGEGGWRFERPYAAQTDAGETKKLIDVLSLAEPGEVMTDAELHRLGRSRADFGLDTPKVAVTVSNGEAKTKIAFGAKTGGGKGVYATVDGQNWVCIVDISVLEAVDRPPEDFRRRDVFPVDPESTVSIDVRRGDGQLARFVRENDEWRMVQPREARASGEKVTRLLAAAAGSMAKSFAWPTGAAGEALSPNAALLAGYGLDPESAVTLTARRSDGSDAQVSFGKEAEGGLVYALAQSSGAIVAVSSEAKELAMSPIESFVETRLFPVEPGKVSRISVDEGGVRYLVGKNDSGAWFLDSPVAAPADAATVDALLKNVLSLTHDDISAPGIEVSVSTSAPPVKVSAQALLDGIRLDDLRSREIFDADMRTVRRVSVVKDPRETPVSLVYDRDRRAWNVESSPEPGAVADAAALENLVSAANPLVADRIVKLKVSAADLKSFGLDSPRATVAIDIEGGVRRNILLGDETAGGVFAALGPAGAVFILPSRVESALLAPLTSGGDISKGDK